MSRDKWNFEITIRSEQKKGTASDSVRSTIKIVDPFDDPIIIEFIWQKRFKAIEEMIPW